MIEAKQKANFENIFISELLFKIDSPFNEIIKSSKLLSQTGISNEKVKSIIKVIQNNSNELLQIADMALIQYKKNNTSFIEEPELIDSIQHEIRTPMNGIIGFAEILNDQKLQYKERASHIFILLNCINRLKTIINSMRNYSLLLASQTKKTYF